MDGAAEGHGFPVERDLLGTRRPAVGKEIVLRADMHRLLLVFFGVHGFVLLSIS